MRSSLRPPADRRRGSKTPSDTSAGAPSAFAAARGAERRGSSAAPDPNELLSLQTERAD